MAIAHEILKQVAVETRIESIETHLRLLLQSLELGPYNEAAQWNAREIEYHLEMLKALVN